MRERQETDSENENRPYLLLLYMTAPTKVLLKIGFILISNVKDNLKRLPFARLLENTRFISTKCYILIYFVEFSREPIINYSSWFFFIRQNAWNSRTHGLNFLT